MKKTKCFTSDKEARLALIEQVKEKRKADRTVAKALRFCQRISRMEKGCVPSAGYMQEIIEEAEKVLK